MEHQEADLEETSDITDNQLVLAVQAGAGDAPAAFDELFRRHGPGLNRWLRHKGYASDETDDLHQETWFRAWQGIRRYVDRGKSFEAWLYGIAKNVLREYQRDWIGTRIQDGAELDQLPASDDIERDVLDVIDHAASVARMNALLTKAPPDYAKSIEALHADFTPAETMELYGWSRDKTDQTKLRAIRWLQKHWDDGAPTAPHSARATP
jgi:RNA polymerase sigma factor (sigma-70 family)